MRLFLWEAEAQRHERRHLRRRVAERSCLHMQTGAAVTA